MKDGPIVFAAFTRAGAELAVKLSRAIAFNSCDALNETSIKTRVFVTERCMLNNAPDNVEVMRASVREWAGEFFAKASAIIFVCACGIAVRAIAPWIKSKLDDPAVVVLDERGKFVIPILSGHIGGANDLARRIAALTGGIAFITTATDVNNLVAVDEWAVKHNCAIENPEIIRDVSATVLENNHNQVGVAVTHELQATPWPVTLWLRPRVLALGVGCKRDVDPDAIHAAALDFLDGAGVSELSLRAIASIDLKANEPALIALAEKFKVPFITFSAQKLANVPGHFTFTITEHADRVREVTGVDNVCERAAVLGAGLETGLYSGKVVLLRSKTIYPGATFALARTRGCR